MSIVIGEAHCASECSDDFREAIGELGRPRSYSGMSRFPKPVPFFVHLCNASPTYSRRRSSQGAAFLHFCTSRTVFLNPSNDCLSKPHTLGLPCGRQMKRCSEMKPLVRTLAFFEVQLRAIKGYQHLRALLSDSPSVSHYTSYSRPPEPVLECMA